MPVVRAFAISIAMLFAWTLNVFADIIEIAPSNFYSNGPAIVGWNWLRSPGHYAEWTFRVPAGISVKRAAVCFSSLSTNTRNGGAGFDSHLKAVASGTRPSMLRLYNDCPCLVYPRNSRGIGYTSHGCLRNVYPIPGETFELRVKYIGGHHSAMKRASAKLIIITP